jgi:hypothetical protein
VSQKVEKKDGPKPPGPGLDNLFMPRKAFFISSGEKGLLRWPGRGEALPYKESILKSQVVGTIVPRRSE